jgi:hypothetical protein
MGYTSPSDLRSSVNSAPIFWVKKDRSQDPNNSHPIYPVHPCLSSLLHIAFYLVNCALRQARTGGSFKVGAGIQRNPIDRDNIGPFGFRQCRGMGKRRIRFTP